MSKTNRGLLGRVVSLGLAAMLPAMPAATLAAERPAQLGDAYVQKRLAFRAQQRDTAYDLTSGGMVSNAAYAAQDLLNAMDVDPNILINPSIQGNDRQYGIFPGLGALTPAMGTNFAWLSSGVAGAGTPQSVDPNATNVESGTNVGSSCPVSGEYDCAFLRFSFQVPAGMNSVRFNFNFMSAEYPEFVNLGFNDEFRVSLSSPTYTYANIVFDVNGAPINIDSAFFNQPCQGLAGSGFEIYSGGSCDAGATGLLTTEAPVVPGETVTMEFSIRDRGDGIYDSAVLIDNFELSTESVSGPNTNGDVAIDWLTPKSGPVAGGTQVQIHGEGFENVQSVSFDGVPALYQVLDEYTIIAVTPPNSAGAVDVSVTASPNNNASTGVRPNAYTYYVHPEGSPLAVLSVDPPEGPADGGVAVTVRGSGFEPGAVVMIDGEAVASAQFINGDEIVVTTPPGRGAAEVRVTNPNGDSEALADGYLYIGSLSSSGNGATGCGCSLDGRTTNPASTAGAGLLGLLLAAWVVRRRRSGERVLAAAMIVIPVAMFATGCNDQSLAPVNSLPIANAGPSTEAFTGDEIALDGTGSRDLESGENLTYAWQFMSKPDGSTAQLDDETSATPKFVADKAGLYRLGLVVTDVDGNQSREIGYGGRDDDELTEVIVLPYLDFRATLTWDTDASDLDLHLVRSPLQGPTVNNYWNAAEDCYYGSPDPEWGSNGVKADNPVLATDVDTGFGPEVIVLPSPQDSGKYDVVVHMFNTHGAGPTNATVTLELGGQPLGEVYSANPLVGTDAVWVVGWISWPDGVFTETNMLTTHAALGGPSH